MGGFAFIWTVDGGGDLVASVPRLLSVWVSRMSGFDSHSLNLFLIPVYILLGVSPVVAYACNPNRPSIYILAGFASVHLLIVAGIIMHDD